MKEPQPLSTSALARALHKTVRQMFAELAVLGWIRRDGEQWQLTAKGEFEEGAYRESSRFGRYIVWPASVLEHRALVQTRNQFVSATVMGRELQLSAQTVNRLLAERGWIYPDAKGWRLTDAGKAQGALQREDERTGIPYVVWTPDICAHPVLMRSVALITSEFDDGPATLLQTLDGHHCASQVCSRICNWLYLAGVTHAVDVWLPVEEAVRCDLYLPDIQLFIDDWTIDTGASTLASRINRQSLCEQHRLNLLQVDDEAAGQLDEWLPRELRKRGLDI